MEKKINIKELLKYCPKGMELDSPMYDNVTFGCIVDGDCYPVQVQTPEGNMLLSQHGCTSLSSHAKCVIFPKGKTTWEGFVPPCKFKDGDILYVDTNNDDDGEDCFKYVFIFKEMCGRKVIAYCYITMDEDDYLKHREVYLIEYSDIYPIRFATEDEKIKLFDIIKENGYYWNPETKTLDELIEPKFKDGDIIADDHGNIAIYKGTMWYNKKLANYHCGYRKLDNKFLPKSKKDGHFGLIEELHFASEGERQKLFNIIQNNGYKWNEKTKTLEKLVEPTPTFKAGDKIKHKENAEWVCTIRRVEDRYYVDGHPTRFTILFSEQDKYELIPNKFDINALKTFDQVLVRLTNNCVWMPKLFSHYDTDSKGKYYPFVTIDNLGYPQCIPYNGNEHLRRTTNNCDEFYRVWEE